jgi:hypothetical protein
MPYMTYMLSRHALGGIFELHVCVCRKTMYTMYTMYAINSFLAHPR